jgi:hypothetical protein
MREDLRSQQVLSQAPITAPGCRLENWEGARSSTSAQLLLPIFLTALLMAIAFFIFYPVSTDQFDFAYRKPTRLMPLTLPSDPLSSPVKKGDTLFACRLPMGLFACSPGKAGRSGLDGPTLDAVARCTVATSMSRCGKLEAFFQGDGTARRSTCV